MPKGRISEGYKSLQCVDFVFYLIGRSFLSFCDCVILCPSLRYVYKRETKKTMQKIPGNNLLANYLIFFPLFIHVKGSKHCYTSLLALKWNCSYFQVFFIQCVEIIISARRLNNSLGFPGQWYVEKQDGRPIEPSGVDEYVATQRAQMYQRERDNWREKR